MKAIIFDAGTLISFSMNGLLEVIVGLKENFNGKFLITKDVKREIIDKPMTIKRFKLEALRVKKLLDEKVLEMASVMDIDEALLDEKTKELKDRANNLFEGRKSMVHLIDSGEASCMALSRMLNERKIENVLAVDERTMRLLSEKPVNLKKLMERRMHSSIRIVKKDFDFFKGFKFIRSTELIYVAYKKGLIKLKNGGGVLDALLWALKFKGCAITGDEIREIKGMK